MLVNFGQGKCPLCGDFCKELEKRTFHCKNCNIAFDEFMIVHSSNLRKYADKYWN